MEAKAIKTEKNAENKYFPKKSLKDTGIHTEKKERRQECK
jgi:hypothetical protein